jgi:VPDSG-CTERM motif
MKKTILFALTTMLSGAMSAFAIPSTLDIDFRSGAWQSATGSQSKTVNNVTATAIAPLWATLTWSATDGLGINSYIPFEDPGEIGPYEILAVSFALGAGNGLTGVWVTQLFNEWIDDAGLLVLNTTQGVGVLGFTGQQTCGLGDQYVSFGGAYNVLSATFFGLGYGLFGVIAGKDYSVAGFTRSVPDGGTTLALLGVALLGLAAFRRRCPE